MKFLILFIVSLFAVELAFAQAAVDPAVPTYLDGVLAWLAANKVLIGGGLGVVEVILRMFPSVNPVSLLVPVKYAFDAVGSLMSFISQNILAPVISSFQNSAAPASLKK